MRTFALLAVVLVLAGGAVWADGWALDAAPSAHDDRTAAVDTMPTAVVATVADIRPSSPMLPLLTLGAAVVLAFAYLVHGNPMRGQASYPASLRLVRAGRRAPPRALAYAVRRTL
jgi:hypothetical protein